MFTINKKNVWDLPNSFIQVIFDQDKVLPSEESFDLFKEPHKFRDFLIELNLYVRGGMVEHYEAVFEDMRKLVTSPSSFQEQSHTALSGSGNPLQFLIVQTKREAVIQTASLFYIRRRFVLKFLDP